MHAALRICLLRAVHAASGGEPTWPHLQKWLKRSGVSTVPGLHWLNERASAGERTAVSMSIAAVPRSLFCRSEMAVAL